MNERELAILLIGAAIPVVLPIALGAVTKVAASGDEAIEKSKIAKTLVDEVAIPLVEAAVGELKKTRSTEAA